MEISLSCCHCSHFQNHHVETYQELPCRNCLKPLFPHATDAFKAQLTLNQCPSCGAAHLYRQKDFNRKLGIGILVVGIALAYFTYGISLLAVTLIDFCLYRFVGEVACCYQCQAQFRHSPRVLELEGFDLEMHDYYRSIEKSK